MITARQIKAARAMLNWDSVDLAKRTGLSRNTISNAENEYSQTRVGTLEIIIKAFQQEGIIFTEDEGVKIKPSGIEVFEGQERFNEFMGFLLREAQKYGGDIRASVGDERQFQKYIQNIETFRTGMMELDKRGWIKGRILAIDGNFKRTWGDLRRAPATSQISPVSFYVFNDNFALVSFAHKNPPYVELHKSSPFAEDFRRLFDLAWESSEPV